MVEEKFVGGGIHRRQEATVLNVNSSLEATDYQSRKRSQKREQEVVDECFEELRRNEDGSRISHVRHRHLHGPRKLLLEAKSQGLTQFFVGRLMCRLGWRIRFSPCRF